MTKEEFMKTINEIEYKNRKKFSKEQIVDWWNRFGGGSAEILKTILTKPKKENATSKLSNYCWKNLNSSKLYINLRDEEEFDIVTKQPL